MQTIMTLSIENGLYPHSRERIDIKSPKSELFLIKITVCSAHVALATDNAHFVRVKDKLQASVTTYACHL